MMAIELNQNALEFFFCVDRHALTLRKDKKTEIKCEEKNDTPNYTRRTKSVLFCVYE